MSSPISFFGFARASSSAPIPGRTSRVYYKRTDTGGATIYLYQDQSAANRPAPTLSAYAFGWVPAELAQNINVPKEGWCNFYKKRPTDNRPCVVFTDNDDPTDSMDELVAKTNFIRQSLHWQADSSAQGASHSNHDSKEVNMAGSFDPYAAAAAQNARLGIKEQSVSRNLRTACQDRLATLADNNKAAAGKAGYLTAGKIANDQLVKQASKHLPLMVRGYADHPVGRLILANTAQQLVQHFKPGSVPANKLADAMLTQAYAEVIASSGIEEFIDSFLNDPKVAKAMAVAGSDD